jgi:hypothetical protein
LQGGREQERDNYYLLIDCGNRCMEKAERRIAIKGINVEMGNLPPVNG